MDDGAESCFRTVRQVDVTFGDNVDGAGGEAGMRVSW